MKSIVQSATNHDDPSNTVASVATRPSLRDELGICQWFHYQDYHALDRTIELLLELGVRHFRTGISWADYVRPDGKAWYDWQMRRLRESGLEVLLSVWHTPPVSLKAKAATHRRAVFATMLMSSTASSASTAPAGTTWNCGMSQTIA